MRRFTVERGAYRNTTDDRLDRWYISDRLSSVVDRRGSGYRTRAEARREATRLEREYERDTGGGNE